MLDPRRWHPNVRWLAIRIAALPVIFVVVSFASFFLIAGPGTPDPADHFIGDPTPEQIELIREELGYNEPFVVRYWDWLTDAGRGDLGTSRFTGEPVRSAVNERWGATAQLLVLALFFALLFGGTIVNVQRLPIGASQEATRALRRLIDALPIFLVAALILYVPLRLWEYEPPMRQAVSFFEHPWDNLRQFIPPAIAVAICAAGTAAAALESVTPGSLARRVCVAIGGVLPIVIASTVVVESVFAVDGLGFLFARSVIFRIEQDVLQALLTLALTTSITWRLLVPIDFANEGETARPYHSSLIIAAAVVLSVFAFLAAVGPYITPHEASAFNLESRFENPSPSHPFGTDGFGRDILSRSIAGARPSFQLAGAVLMLGYVPGALAALLLRHAWPERGRLLDVGYSLVTSIPVLLVALAATLVRYDDAVSWTVGTLAILVAVATILGGLRNIPANDGESRALLLHLAAGGLRVIAAVLLIHGLMAWLRADPFGLGQASWGGDASEVARFGAPVHFPVLVFPAYTLALAVLSCGMLADALTRPAKLSPQS